MFSSTTTQFNLMSGLSASNLVESFLSSIIAGLLTVAMVTVCCWARTLTPVKRTIIIEGGTLNTSFLGYSNPDDAAYADENPLFFKLRDGFAPNKIKMSS